ncbi:hypothetical protein F5Y12DRAFT_800159 [Xylaria sp. FL1777]|nr:hypothetical protein F5Y12DRAFT_800159 [Xylaria sp. FL1777]
MVLGSSGDRSRHGQEERHTAIKNLQTWAEDFEYILHSIPEDEWRYCTQKCLLGLVGNGSLDQNCPKVIFHTTNSSGVNHPVTHAQWLQLLEEQLRKSLNNGIMPLNSESARGVLFQVTLLAYGYTFVSKDTIETFVGDLKHEAAVSGRLRPLQGRSLLVFLGAIDLRPMKKVYYYDHRVYVIYLTLLSWAGPSLHKLEIMDGGVQQIQKKMTRCLRSIHRQGVAHTEVEVTNMLVDPETKQVVLIDFERALLLEPPSIS